MSLTMISALGNAAASIGNLLDRFERSAARVASPGPPSADHVRETVDQMGVRYGVAANAAVIRASDEMTGTLFDIVA